MSEKNNRERMPTVAAMVDEWRKQFPDLKVVYASENGITIDKRGDESNVFTIPKGYRMPAEKNRA
jgi:hypothetical protein